MMNDWVKTQRRNGADDFGMSQRDGARETQLASAERRKQPGDKLGRRAGVLS